MNQLYVLRNEINGFVGAYVGPAVAAAFLNYANGWIPAPALAYSSADAPSYVVTCSGDYSGIITPGCRVKLTHGGSTKYFIVTKASHADGTTTFTLYGGTDYTLASGAITSPYFSTHKAPRGFPLDPVKWSETLSSYSDAFQASPAQDTWYNLGSLSMDLPIGVWRVSYQVCAYIQVASVPPVLHVSLSTSNNAATDPNWTTKTEMPSVSGFCVSTVHRAGLPISLAAKTTYYLIEMTSVASVTTLSLQGSASRHTIIAECAYL